MANKDRPPKAEGDRARAVRRLNEVVTERRRLRDPNVTAKGASGEAGAGSSLSAAKDSEKRPGR